MPHVVAVTDLIVGHLTESRETDAEASRLRRRSSREGFLGAVARAIFGARA